MHGITKRYYALLQRQRRKIPLFLFEMHLKRFNDSEILTRFNVGSEETYQRD
jgi:hypothetical protein